MDFAQERHPLASVSGLAVVLVSHAAFAYAIGNGLGRKAIEVLKKPLEVALIEELKPAPQPPPPKPVALPSKQVAATPPAYVPPADIPVHVPAQSLAITATTSTPQPAAEVAVSAATVPAARARTVAAEQEAQPVAVALACPNHAEVRASVVFPPQAERMGLSGDVLVECSVTPSGAIANIQVVRSTHPVFNAAATAAVARLRCNAQGQTLRVQVPFAFRLER